MLRRIWLQIEELWRYLVGFLAKRGMVSRRVGTGGEKKRFGLCKTATLPLQTLTSEEYEFLFAQLLEGVHQGWSQAQVLKFIEGLSEGGNSNRPIPPGGGRLAGEEWVAWLRRFGDRLLASPVPNQELATRMVQLGLVGCGDLGLVAGEIGSKLLSREKKSPAFVEECPEANENKQVSKSKFADVGVNGWIERGLAQLDRRQYPSALTSFQEAAELEPQNPLVLYGLGLACHRLGLYQEAVEQLSLALEVNRADATVRTQRGLAYKALHWREKATADFEQAIATTPCTAADWCGRGKALVELYRHNDAIAAYDEALKLWQSCHLAWYERGNALYDLQRYDEAIASYDEAIKLQPDYAAACFNRGAALGNLHRYKDAIAAFERVLAIQPHDYHAWLSRGQTLDRLHRPEDAVTSYDQALKIRPDDPTAWRYRNDTLSKLKKG